MQLVTRVVPILTAVALSAFALFDDLSTPRDAVRRLPRWGWALLIVGLPLAGALAWLLAGRPARLRLAIRRSSGRHPSSGRIPSSDPPPASEWPAASEWPPPEWPLASGSPTGEAAHRARTTPPSPFGVAGRDAPRRGQPSSGPIGPDDDPEFLRQLARLVEQQRRRNGGDGPDQP